LQPERSREGAPVQETRAAARERRSGGRPQDRAVYNCQCGMVFDAAVSTAVSCPHCGHKQAW